MSQTEPALHYVCTWEEAAWLVSTRDAFWVSNCSCRVSRGGCNRGRTDFSLQFLERTAADTGGLHPLNKEERCDKGRFIERTNVSECNDCGGCVDVCHFGARAIVGGRLALSMEECYGCGTCVASCHLDCIEMVERA